MYSNGYYYDDSGIWAIFAAAMGFWLLLVLAFAVVICIAWWKVFEKAGEDGWKALVPVLNAYTLSKIAWGNGWFFLLGLAAPIPVIGWLIVLAYSLMTCYKLAKSFGKDTGFMFGLYFLAPVFFMILGFGNAQYRGIYIDGNYFNPNFPPMEGFQAPWEMIFNRRPVQPNYGQQYQQPYQGQPMNGQQGGFQGQPMNNGQNGYQGQPNQPNNWNQNNPQ